MNDMQDKVMQANGINQHKVPDQQRKGIQELIKRENRRLMTVQILTGFFWSASLIILGSYMFAVKLRYHYLLKKLGDLPNSEIIGMVEVLETLLPLTIIIATACSVFLYIRAKSVHLLQVHERLQNLEEMVKVLLSK